MFIVLQCKDKVNITDFFKYAMEFLIIILQYRIFKNNWIKEQ